LNYQLYRPQQQQQQQPMMMTTTMTTTTTTTTRMITKGNDGFTADEAIKLFQTNLIEKEKNIGGILNASVPFYRHFNLQYKSSAISVRCLYNSN